METNDFGPGIYKTLYPLHGRKDGIASWEVDCFRLLERIFDLHEDGYQKATKPQAGNLKN